MLMKKYIIVFLITLLFSAVSFTQTKNNILPLPILKPPHLKPGDTVALVSSAFRVPRNIMIEQATERLQALGLKVKYGKSISKYNKYFAGTDKERADDLNAMFADPNIKAIFEVRGGFGSSRLLPYLDYESIKKHPKILIGFSDITALLLGIHAKTGLVTFHGTMGFEPWPDFTVKYLKEVLFSNKKTTFKNPVEIDTEIDIIQTENRIQTINGGVAIGKLFGGNLTVLTSIIGSDYLPDWKGAILFVENADGHYERIDRMMAQLQIAGILDQLSGFIFGQCVDCFITDTSPEISTPTLPQILEHYLKPLGIPAWTGAMISHAPKMFTLPEGSIVKIDADKGTITMLESATK